MSASFRNCGHARAASRESRAIAKHTGSTTGTENLRREAKATRSFTHHHPATRYGSARCMGCNRGMSSVTTEALAIQHAMAWSVMRARIARRRSMWRQRCPSGGPVLTSASTLRSWMWNRRRRRRHGKLGVCTRARGHTADTTTAVMRSGVVSNCRRRFCVVRSCGVCDEAAGCSRATCCLRHPAPVQMWRIVARCSGQAGDRRYSIARSRLEQCCTVDGRMARRAMGICRNTHLFQHVLQSRLLLQLLQYCTVGASCGVHAAMWSRRAVRTAALPYGSVATFRLLLGPPSDAASQSWSSAPIRPGGQAVCRQH